MRIIFMGTPEIAAYCLKKIHESQNQIVAVVTSVDKPAGRRLKLKESEVKIYASENNIKIFQPEKLKDENFIKELKNFNADLFIVVAFRMLPKIVWEIPKFGTVNLHASLLPNYRGAAPINWAIINGESKTGITTFLIDEKIDTGKIIAQREIEIDFQDNADSLHDKIMYQGADLLLETIDLIENQKINPLEQNSLIAENISPKPAPKIFKDDCKINWNQNSLNIYNFIRGLSPFPTAWSILKMSENEITLKIISTNPIIEKHNLKPGQIISDKKSLKVATLDGFLELKKIIPQGKKLMSGADFGRGNNLKDAFLI